MPANDRREIDKNVTRMYFEIIVLLFWKIKVCLFVFMIPGVEEEEKLKNNIAQLPRLVRMIVVLHCVFCPAPPPPLQP